MGLMFIRTPTSEDSFSGTYLDYLKEPLDLKIHNMLLLHPLPDVPKFKGEGNPNSHIKAYMMTVREIFPWDIVVARIFPKTLEGIMLNWYYYLPKVSIHFFIQPIGDFVIPFNMNKLVKARI